VERTLSCLSKLYRCLEPSVFTGLAQVLESWENYYYWGFFCIFKKNIGCSLHVLLNFFFVGCYFYQEAVEVCSDSVQVSNLNINSQYCSTWWWLESHYALVSSPSIFIKIYSPQKASKLITKRSTAMDGQLFLIKHILILREQVISLIPPICLFGGYLVIHAIWFTTFKFCPFRLHHLI
jgi:hypothetical protein